MMKKRTAWIVPIGLTTLALLSLVAIGCGGGGGDGDGDFDGADGASTQLNSGVFTDSPVAGLQYRTDTQTGVTDEEGTFHYRDGETIDFHLGDADLGSAPAEPLMTPLHLVSGAEDETDPHVTNMVRFLQTLDADGEPANGIHIPSEMQAFMEGRVIDFRMSETMFETDPDVEKFMDDLMRRDGYGHVDGMVEIHEAQDHMRETLTEQMAGHYTAEYDGDDAGVMEIDVHEDGTFQGTATSHLDDQTHAVSGVVESDGELHFNDAGDFDFTGEIHRGMGPGQSRTLEVSAMHEDGMGAPDDGSDMPDQGDDGDHSPGMGMQSVVGATL